MTLNASLGGREERKRRKKAEGGHEEQGGRIKLLCILEVREVRRGVQGDPPRPVSALDQMIQPLLV